MKFSYLIAIVIAANLACVLGSAASESTKQPAGTIARPTSPSASKKLQAMRRMLIERTKESRESLRESLRLYEERLAAQRAEIETKKKLYEEDLISKLELENSQQAMTNMQLEAERIRHWIAEDDVALSLADENARAEIGALRGLAPGGYQETPTIIRYHGVMPWSPAVIAKVRKFFQERFGTQLPISVVGQSVTQ